MLILPPGHAKAVLTRRPLTVRERRLAGAVLATVVALVAVIVISLSASGGTSSNGCIFATIPAPTGAQEIHECGASARATCATSQAVGAFTAQAAQTIAAECRKAGLPVGQ